MKLLNIEPIKVVGLKFLEYISDYSQKEQGSDGYIARQIADFYETKRQYFHTNNLDIKNIEKIMDRF